MAAASAGSLQSGSPITGMMPTSTSSNVVDNQLPPVIQAPSTVYHQQSVQPQNPNLQFHQQQQGGLPQPHPFLPRAGNGSQLSGSIARQCGGANEESLIGSGPSGMIAGPQQLQHSSAAAMIQQRQSHVMNVANLAPGWRRLISNNEVIYISPSGASLRTHGQIKDYLLSPSTCKCGLPCPLRPEHFFDFNSQVPNSSLHIAVENGLTSRMHCQHQKRFIENNHNLQQKDFKRRKFNDATTSKKLITSPVPQCNSVAVYSGNVMQTSHLVGNSGRMHIVPSQRPNQQLVTNTSTQHSINTKQPAQMQENLLIKVENEKQIGNVTLSKTPPWRKNYALQQQHGNQQQSSSQQNHISASTSIIGQAYVNNNNNERVPPLPQSHFCPTPLTGQNLTPPWHNEQPQNRFVKARSSPVAVKKKPNFKDDPTGYMDHQTAILHSSILNIVQTPEEPVIEDNYKSEQVAGGATVRTPAQKPILQQIKIEAGTSLMPQNQNVYPHNSIPDGKIPHIKTEPSQMDVKTFVQTAGRVCVGQFGGYHHSEQQQQMAPQPANFAHSQQPRMITPSQVIETSLKNHQIQTGTQQVIANVPSSQQIIEKSGPVIRTQYQSDEHINQMQQQATTTTIGGQTVTHFPNGMVQVEQNCDSIATLKPQQQIQLQQQIQQHNMLYRQNQQIQKSIGKVATDFSYNDQKNLPVCIVPVSQDSPVSSSTTLNRITPERRTIPDNKGPPQVGAISTSNQSPHPCPSPADSPETSSTSMKPPTPHSVSSSQIRPQQGIFATSQTSGRNTITSVTAGKTITATTSVSDRSALHAANTNNVQQPQQRLSQNNIIPVSNIQLQSVVRESPNQIIMTSTGQLIVVPSQSNKSSNQVIINSPTGSNLVVNNQQNVLINQQSPQLIGNSVEVLNNQSNSANIIQGPGNGLVIQNSGIVQPGQNILQSPNNLITNNNSNFIVNSSSTMQSMILNNSNLLQQGGQGLITANATNIMQTSGGSNIVTAGNSSKVISNNGNILNNQSIITNQPNVINNQVLSNNSNGGILGQQTVVLNTLPNGYVIQPNFVDGQVVNQIMTQENGNTYLQQQQQQPRHIILTSPDSKRKAKKRKSSASSSPSTPSSLSPQQSPTIQQQVTPQSQNQSAVVQIAPQYPAQGFQISSGIQGIVVNKNTQPTGPQQQILFQNGQIIQPVNLIGQQLLVPAGLVVAPETTLVQIQNVGSCGSIITPQGMVLRAPSPQNKNFLSPNASGQQFIVSGNSQMSPLGQLYGTPVGLMVPQSNAGTATFVQQSTAIVQQTAMVNNNNNNSNSSNSSSSNNNSSGNCNNSNNGSDNCNEQSSQNQGMASPPDTTTHSPRSPERPPSEKSGGSDMVQCVSSSEPDSVVSPVVADSAQSPSTTEYERSGSISYQTNNAYKPSDAKIRKMEASLQFGSSTQEISSQMKPDSHESPTNSPPASATSAISSSGSTGPRSLSSGCGSGQLPSFSIGELVWGPARGHPAWPGKVINPPDGICTPSDSTWVQWFGGRPNIELIAINSLKSLSEGLEAHHKAQKDTRKSRKLNSQLERAIQEAMTELDRMSSVVQPTSTATTALSSSKNRGRGRQPSSLGQARTKPVKIAPAPPCANNTIQQVRPQQQAVAQVAHHQQPAQPQQTSPTQSK